MKSIDNIISAVLLKEGDKYTNDPKDSGGPTKYGVTQATLARYRNRNVSPNEVAALTESEARTILYQLYVADPGFAQVLLLSEAIAAELIDTGVNTGPARPTMMLQRLLNALNREENDYPDVRVDGQCGPATLDALSKFLRLRRSEGERVLLAGLNGLQVEFYVGLAERRPKDERFVYGWLKERVA